MMLDQYDVAHILHEYIELLMDVSSTEEIKKLVRALRTDIDLRQVKYDDR